MIAKRVARKSGRSSFQQLAEYILDTQHNGQKVAHAWTSHCSADDDFELAIAEITATQKLNTRSKIDKTYHLVVSLAEGEKLNAEEFEEVERSFCQAIGLGEHQRICVVHHDTDHLHLHLAISKVHPLTLNCTEPYYDYPKMQVVCRELEQRFGLQLGVSQDKSQKEPRLQPLEIHQGLESFQSWIKAHFHEEFMALLKNPESRWQDAQDLAGKFGLEIRERGAGLVFSHSSEKLFVKTSSIDRSFSKKALEDRLGKFERAEGFAQPSRQYIKSPRMLDAKSKELYVSYLTERESLTTQRREMLATQLDLKTKKIEEIKARYAERRQEIRFDTLIAKGRKREIYRKVSEQMKKELDLCYQKERSARSDLYPKLAIKSWPDWVYEKAQDGNETALKILRATHKPMQSKDSAIGRIEGVDDKPILFRGMERKVLRNGVVDYGRDGRGFYDHGNHLVMKSNDDASVKAALLVAQVKYGANYKISGVIDFLALCSSLTPQQSVIKKAIHRDRSIER